MSESPRDHLLPPRGEEEREYTDQLEQIVQHALHRTQQW